MPTIPPLGPVTSVPQLIRRRLTPLRSDVDEFSILTGGGGSAQSFGTLSGRLEIGVARAKDDTLYFTFRVSKIEGQGQLVYVTAPFPGLFYGGDMDAGYFNDGSKDVAPTLVQFDGRQVTFSGFVAGGTGGTLTAGHASKTFFIRTDATAWVRSGRVRYWAETLGLNSGVASGIGTHGAFVPFMRDDVFESFVDGPARIFGGIAQGGGGVIWLPGSGGVPVPPPRPDAVATRLAELSALLQAGTAWARGELNEKIRHEVRQEIAALTKPSNSTTRKTEK